MAKPSQLCIKNIDFANFLAYEDVFSTLSHASKEQMNALIVYDTLSNALYFVIEEAASYAFTKIQGDFEFQMAEGAEEQQVFGTGISSDLLFYTLANYSKEEQKGITFTIEFGTEGGFLIQMGSDKVALPCKYLTHAKLADNFHTIIGGELPEDAPIFQLSQFGEGRNDFLKGIINSSKFLSKDERKNNAYAIYGDKIVVNDKRHIFVYRYDTATAFIPKESEPISLHKTSARIFMLMTAKNLPFDAIMFDNSRVYLTSGEFIAVVNNSIANINPPDVATLKALIPETLVTTVTAGALLTSTSFFTGFYRGNAEYRPITFEVQDAGIKFLLKDSGVSGSASCNVERIVPCGIYEEGKKKNTENPSVLSDSLISFVKDFLPGDAIDIRMEDNKKLHPAVYLENPKRSVYLAKLD